MNSPYQYSYHYSNRNSNTASTSTSNNHTRSSWNNEQENDFLTLPPIHRANPGNRLELPSVPGGLSSSSPLFIPETHTRQVQAEQSLNGSTSNVTASASANSFSFSNITSAVSATLTNSPSNQSRIKRPRSGSPSDLFNFDPFDESFRYRSTPPPPPSHPPLSSTSNQVAQQNSYHPARGSSLYDEDAEALINFDWDSYLSHDDNIDDPFASPPRIPSRASDTHGVVDLTDSLPAMAPPERQRALSGTSLRPATLTRPTPPKRRRSIISKPTKRRKISTPKTRPAKVNSDEDVEVVDLAENSNLQEFEAAQAKRQEDLIKQQNQTEATKPVKLVDFQCIICMDNPTDLTVTHCGTLSTIFSHCQL